MTVLAGTATGVYRVGTVPFDSAECVLDGPGVREVRAGPAEREAYAATREGLFRTPDCGETWADLGVPVPDVHSVLVTDQGMYAGVRPAGLYRSTDGGDTWREVEGFGNLTDRWPTAAARDEAWVRTLATTPGGTTLAGVEVGGLVTNAGGTWRTHPAVPDDVHHVLAVTDTRWVVSCGTGGPGGEGGVFETRDSGETWTRRETGPHSYVRESCFAGRLYTAGNRSAPPWTPADATMLVESDGQLRSVEYPGKPESYVVSWTAAGGATSPAVAGETVLAGTNEGTMLSGRGTDWERAGTVPVPESDRRAYGVRSLATVGGGD